ncbi:hypothetical protein [uncultured Serinicoccus sp.]|uniref:hypothetical protein n=1 Tax=uncultured Serinicoccus sp. TaxID=735514 RepID=UPI002635B776|nr:hypothetical protein [uncultured Serinicoccus sp.]
MSVDIEAMRDLVRDLRGVEDELGQAESRVRQALTGLGLSARDLTGVDEIGDRATRQHLVLRNQLFYAEWLAASAPGIQRTVSYDHQAVPDLSYEEAKQFADRARDLMDTDSMPPPQELIDLLEHYGGDATFALLVLDGYREGDGYATMDLGPSIDLDYLEALDDSPASERFLQLYAGSLGVLSHEFDFPGAGDVTYARAFALLASRGDWSADWLVGLGEDVIHIEQEDPEAWAAEKVRTGTGTYDWLPMFRDPQGADVVDPMPWVLEAMSRNPEALRAFLLGGEDVPIRVQDGDGDDDDDVDIPANLRHLTLERGWMQGRGASLGAALVELSALDPGSIDQHLENLDRLKPMDGFNPLSFFTHLGLDIVGLVPGVGEWADGLNVALYVGEGKYVNAGFSSAAAIPGAGAGSTIAKWIRHVNQAGYAGGVTLTAKDIKDLIRFRNHADQGDPSGPGLDVLDEADVRRQRVGGWQGAPAR